MPPSNNVGCESYRELAKFSQHEKGDLLRVDYVPHNPGKYWTDQTAYHKAKNFFLFIS